MPTWALRLEPARGGQSPAPTSENSVPETRHRSGHTSRSPLPGAPSLTLQGLGKEGAGLGKEGGAWDVGDPGLLEPERPPLTRPSLSGGAGLPCGPFRIWVSSQPWQHRPAWPARCGPAQGPWGTALRGVFSPELVSAGLRVRGLPGGLAPPLWATPWGGGGHDPQPSVRALILLCRESRRAHRR